MTVKETRTLSMVLKDSELTYLHKTPHTGEFYESAASFQEIKKPQNASKSDFSGKSKLTCFFLKTKD